MSMRLEDVTPGGDHARFQSVNAGIPYPQHHSASFIVQSLILYDKEQDRRSVICCYLARLVAAGLIHCAATLISPHHDTVFET